MEHRRHLGVMRYLVAFAAIWLTWEVIGSALAVVRHAIALAVVVIVVVVGWRIARAGKS